MSKLKVFPNQLFKISVLLDGGFVRDEFIGMGQEEYNRVYPFAERLNYLVRGKIVVRISTRHIETPVNPPKR